LRNLQNPRSWGKTNKQTNRQRGAEAARNWGVIGFCKQLEKKKKGKKKDGVK
jgi:hypothetical protein